MSETALERAISYDFRTTDQGFLEYGLIATNGGENNSFLSMLAPGSSVLDLGAGKYNRFARELGLARPDLKITSLNPNLISQENRDAITEALDDDKSTSLAVARKALGEYSLRWVKDDAPAQPAVAALGHQLPFKDASFDTIFAFNSVPYYLRFKELATFTADLERVLKPGGSAFLYPNSCCDKSMEVPAEDRVAEWQQSSAEVITIRPELAAQMLDEEHLANGWATMQKITKFKEV